MHYKINWTDWEVYQWEFMHLLWLVYLPEMNFHVISRVTDDKLENVYHRCIGLKKSFNLIPNSVYLC